MVLTFQQRLARIPSATVMRKLLSLILSVLAIASAVRGETADNAKQYAGRDHLER